VIKNRCVRKIRSNDPKITKIVGDEPPIYAAFCAISTIFLFNRGSVSSYARENGSSGCSFCLFVLLPGNTASGQFFLRRQTLPEKPAFYENILKKGNLGRTSVPKSGVLKIRNVDSKVRNAASHFRF
jgi:hypothetical protein